MVQPLPIPSTATATGFFGFQLNEACQGATTAKVGDNHSEWPIEPTSKPQAGQIPGL